MGVKSGHGGKMGEGGGGRSGGGGLRRGLWWDSDGWVLGVCRPFEVWVFGGLFHVVQLKYEKLHEIMKQQF